MAFDVAWTASSNFSMFIEITPLWLWAGIMQGLMRYYKAYLKILFVIPKFLIYGPHYKVAKMVAAYNSVEVRTWQK